MSEVLDAVADYQDESLGSGGAFILKWFKDGPWGEAAQHIIWQFIAFYGMLLVGFGFLWLMIRSTTQVRQKMREVRKEIAETLRTQQQRQFDLENYSSMAYGGIA